MSYKAAIIDAIASLKDRTGSSSIAIKKVVQEKFPKDKKFVNGMFLNALKAAVEKGELVKTKGSFKLAKKPAAPKKPAVKKAAATAAPKKKTAPKKKAAPKKKVRLNKHYGEFMQYCSIISF